MAEQTQKPKCVSYARVVHTKISGEAELTTGFSQLQQETIANNTQVCLIGYISNTSDWDKEAGAFGPKILHRQDMYKKYVYELQVSHPLKAMRKKELNSSVRIKILSYFPLSDILTSETEQKYVVVILENGSHTKGDKIGQPFSSLTNRPYMKNGQLVGALECSPKQVLELVKPEKESDKEPVAQDTTTKAQETAQGTDLIDTVLAADQEDDLF